MIVTLKMFINYVFSRAFAKAECDLFSLSYVCVYVDHFWLYPTMHPL